ncbi:uncharacterized protein LOC110728679 [Chenopodium quinoa]|uniref:uncharacterized protein LOC110728679 n=1 Tax=Chenopodium quinoa TaxID=63459 RepID=UPI000B77602A|nr:uncharacterized protein LOC110728679 [Chenopodium quinoa]
MNKTEEQVIEIIEDVVRHHMDWKEGQRESSSKGRSAVYSVDHLNAINNLTSQIANLGKEMTSIKAKLESSSSQQERPSQSKGRANSNVRGPRAQQDNYYTEAPPQKSSLEEMMETQAKMFNTIMATSDKKFNEVMTHNKILETQISQLATAIKEGTRTSKLQPQGLDPKRQVNAISTRSGKLLKESKPKKTNERVTMNEPSLESEFEQEDERSCGNEKGDEVEKEVRVENEREIEIEKRVQKEKEKEPTQLQKLPYPHKFVRHKLDVKFGKFLESLKQVHLSIPFTDAIKQMPNYARFLKDIVSGRRSCVVVETVNFTESCSVIIMNKMPPKLGDPGNFSIPFAINRIQNDNALCDLGASVSLMPYTVYQRLDIGELFPTNITLQLAYRSIKFTKGKVEDVPLRVGKFVIPVDFVVLDMDEDVHNPIILGRPFPATSGALVDVKSAKITLKFGEEVLEFDLNESMKYPSSTLEKCMKIDTIDCIVNSMQEHLFSTNNALENVLLNKEKIGDQSKEMALYEELLDENVEGNVEQACMGITPKHAMEISPTKEGKGVLMVELKPLPSHLRRMPFGLCNAPETFQRCMMSIFGDMLEEEMEVFMDDFSVGGLSFEDCLTN